MLYRQSEFNLETVTASPVTATVISVHFSGALQSRLGVEPQRDRLEAAYGQGKYHGHLRLIRAFASAPGIPLFPLRDGCGFNLRLRFLPRAELPLYPMSLPHRWEGRFLLLDYRLLQK